MTIPGGTIPGDGPAPKMPPTAPLAIGAVMVAQDLGGTGEIITAWTARPVLQAPAVAGTLDQVAVWNNGQLEARPVTISSGGTITAAGATFRNGISPAAVEVYGSYTDASNYERSRLYGDGTRFYLTTENAGTGQVRPLWISSGGELLLQSATGRPLVLRTQSGLAGEIRSDAFNQWTITADSGTRIPLTIKGVTGQTGKYLRAIDVNSAEVFSVSAAGTVSLHGSTSGTATITPTASGGIAITPASLQAASLGAMSNQRTGPTNLAYVTKTGLSNTPTAIGSYLFGIDSLTKNAGMIYERDSGNLSLVNDAVNSDAWTFSKRLTITPTGTATFSGSLTANGAIRTTSQTTTATAETGVLDYHASTDTTRIISYGPDASTIGKISLIAARSDGTGDVTVMTTSTAGAATFSGNVSIGGDTALAPLHIKGDSAFLYSNASSLTVGNTVKLLLGSHSGFNSSAYYSRAPAIGGVTEESTNAGLALYTYNTGSQHERVRISSTGATTFNGSVGVGMAPTVYNKTFSVLGNGVIVQGSGMTTGQSLASFFANTVTGDLRVVDAAIAASGSLESVHFNSSATTGNSRNILRVAGSGDALTRWEINGGQIWAAGLDNSDGDKFKISGSGTLGSNDYLTISTTGATTFSGNVNISGTIFAGATTINGDLTISNNSRWKNTAGALGLETYYSSIGVWQPGYRQAASAGGVMCAFFGGAPVLQPAALTAAIADVATSSDAAIVDNLRTRVNEIESRLTNLHLIAA